MKTFSRTVMAMPAIMLSFSLGGDIKNLSQQKQGKYALNLENLDYYALKDNKKDVNYKYRREKRIEEYRKNPENVLNWSDLKEKW